MGELAVMVNVKKLNFKIHTKPRKNMNYSSAVMLINDKIRAVKLFTKMKMKTNQP